MLEGLKRGALLQLARLIARYDPILCLVTQQRNLISLKKSRDSVLLFFNPGLGFSTRAWDPLNPGLNHIQIRESFHTLFEPKKNRTGLYSKLSMRSLDCIASIRELLDPLTGLDRKMSRVPSSVLLFALLEDVGELIGAERAWTVTKTDDGLMMGNDTNGQEKSSRTESVPLGEKKPASLLLVRLKLHYTLTEHRLTMIFCE